MSKTKTFYFDKIDKSDDLTEVYSVDPKPARTKLTIVRGLPGSGKSTYAKQYASCQLAHTNRIHHHFEADQFFMLHGEYQFDPRLISAAHDWCYSKTVFALRRGYDVVVSNTFTRMWELERYLNIPAIVDNVKISVVEMLTQYDNVHGVPEDKLRMMQDRWQTIDWTKIDGGIPFKVIK